MRSIRTGEAHVRHGGLRDRNANTPHERACGSLACAGRQVQVSDSSGTLGDSRMARNAHVRGGRCPMLDFGEGRGFAGARNEHKKSPIAFRPWGRV